MIKNLRTATPVEIDTVLSALLQKQYAQRDIIERTQGQIRRIEAGRKDRYDLEWLDRLRETVGQAKAELDKLVLEAAPLNEEFNRRGGWTRGFLVTNAGGHVHRTMACNTCYSTTRFAWLTQVSGADEASIVDQAGDKACTVCYPSAPVAVDPNFVKPNQFMTPEQAAFKAEKEAKDAAKKAKEAVTGIKDIDGGELRVIEGHWDRATSTDIPGFGRVVKTERAARNEISSSLQSLAWYSPSHPTSQVWINNVHHLAAAVANKTGEDVQELLAAVAGRVVKKVGTQGRVHNVEQLLTWLSVNKES